MQDRIEKTIEIHAPVERVWQAVTDHEEFGQWFSVKLDGPFVVGGASHGRITLKGYEHLEWDATVKAMEPERYFAYSWWPLDGTETLVEFILAPAEGGTKLTIRESGFAAMADAKLRAEAFLRNSGGWEQQAQNIAAHVETQC